MTELPAPPVPADADLPPARSAWRSIGDIIRPVVKTAIVEAGRREVISAREAEDLIEMHGLVGR